MIHTFSAPVVDFFCFSRRDLKWGGKQFVIFNIATLLYVTAIHKITQTSFQYFVQLGLKHGKSNSTNSKKETQMHLALVSFCSGIQKKKKEKKISIYLCNASCSSSCASSSSTIELLSVSAIKTSEKEQEEVLANDRQMSLEAARDQLIFTNTGGNILQHHPRKMQT